MKIEGTHYLLTEDDRVFLNEIQKGRDWARGIFDAMQADDRVWKYLGRVGTFADEIELYLEDECTNQDVDWALDPENAEPVEP